MLLCCGLAFLELTEGVIFECTFDANTTCGMSQSQDDQFDWTLNKGATRTWETGPSADRSGTGYYLYIEVSGPTAGDAAVIVTPSLGGSDRNLSFSYNMHGADIGSLLVYSADNENLTNPTLLWQRHGQTVSDDPKLWIDASFRIPDSAQFIYFKANKSKNDPGTKGDIAIDEVRVMHKDQTTPYTGLITTSQWKLSTTSQRTTILTTIPTIPTTTPAPTIPTTSISTRTILTSTATTPTTTKYWDNTNCNGDLTAQTGNIRSPSYPRYYHSYADCTWRISVQSGYNIQITFHAFDVEDSPTCSRDSVAIYEDLSKSTLFNRYCGTTSPGTITIQSNTALVFFSSDYLNTFQTGYNATYTAIYTGVCGGLLTAPSGTILSPEYPSNYPVNANCTWNIVVSEEYNIQLVFNDFLLEDSNTCASDVLAVYDGDKKEISLGRFCGSTKPASLISSNNTMTIEFKSDSYNSLNGFNITYKIAFKGVCGGILTSPSGMIESPLYPAFYPINTNCSWLISAGQDYTIHLTFSSFQLESQTDCANDALYLYDGTTGQNLIGRYCGNYNPGILISTTNGMRIEFKSNSAVTYPGFSASYRAMYNQACGSTLTSATGVIETPNYPGDYPYNVNCTWTITVGPGYIIQLTFDGFQLENHDKCEKDAVIIYGNSQRQSMLGSFCGATIPGIITSTENTMVIDFRSDSSNVYSGFHATYATTYAQGCGGALSGTSGLISSPNYPNNYPINANCNWAITVGSDYVIHLIFTMFSLESHNNCSLDYVVVYGSSQRNQLIGRYCGSNSPGTVITMGNIMFIDFKSNSNNTYPGFTAMYKAVYGKVCGGNLSSDKGIISSPGYPNNYPINANCAWRITVGPEYVIHLTFQAFYLESQSNCAADAVIVYGDIRRQTELRRYCGSSDKAVVVATGNTMLVDFISDSANTFPGFMANYEAFYAKVCGGSLTSSSGSIRSPEYPSNYPINVNCTWTITVEPIYTIQLTFNTFQLESQSNCEADSVSLYDDDRRQTRIGRYCGTNNVGVINSSGSTMLIDFRSDSQNTDSGFSIAYTSIYKEGCSQILTTDTGELRSPEYPENYPINALCTWSISVGADYVVQLKFTTFQLEDHINCDADYLAVYSSSQKQILLGKYCGSSVPANVVSPSNRMYIEFRSNINVTSAGFVASYNAVYSRDCSRNLTTSTGGISSPQYPSNYPINANCTWNINVDPQYIIHLTFHQFYLESQSDCGSDALVVYDNIYKENTLGRFCGSRIPDTVVSSGNTMFVQFISDSRSTFPGFNATYKAIYARDCGGSLVATSGVFQSPNYPSNYPVNTDCQWTINVGSEYIISLTFNSLQLESHSSCTADSVSVYNNERKDILLNRYCGSIDKAEVVSQGNTMLVDFISDSANTFSGFTASYEVFYAKVCGGSLTSSSGLIRSPEYPFSYPVNVNCTWTITVETIYTIQLTFNTFQLESQSNCEADSVSLYDDDRRQTRIGRYCGASNVGVINSSGSTMLIDFQSDSQTTDSGFSVGYTSIYNKGCSQTLTTDTGELRSPEYPRNYPINALCTWSISVGADYVVQLKFTTFQLEDLMNCDADYVAVYSSNQKQNLLGKYCGSSIPETVVSPTNMLYIEFRSNINRTFAGFMASYEAVYSRDCSGVLTASTGSISSPQYPSNYPINANCTWNINVDPQYIIHLTFHRFDLESQSDCRSDALVVYDNIYKQNTLGRFCGSRLPDMVVSSVNTMFVEFRSDSRSTFPGFNATYKAIYARACGGSLIATSGVFQSPNYPSNYPVNTNCQWTINVGSEYIINLTFNSLQLESHSSCTADSVSVYNNDGKEVLLNRYCGNRTSTSVTSTGNVLFVEFVSDTRNTYSGFSATYMAVYSRACGENLTALSGVVESPEYPSLYPVNAACSWRISVSREYVIHLSFQTFHLQSDINCASDAVIIYGDNQKQNVLGRYCGDISPGTVISTGNTMLIEFTSNINITYQGFRATYNAVYAKACGGTLNTSTASWSSPEYPSNYPVNANCTWDINVGPEYVIRLQFGTFHLDSNCDRDAVVVYENIHRQTSIGRYCGSIIPPEITSSGNTMVVAFTSDSSNTFKGFTASYTAVYARACGGSLISTSGSIESPNYPNNYPANSNCSWTIDVGPQYTIILTFEAFNLESNSNCASDVVVIYADMNRQSLIGRFCGNDLPDTIRSTGSTLLVDFASDSNNAFSGFRASYTAKYARACDKSLTALSGGIQSPNYPSNYPVNAECSWIISVPSDYTLHLTFNAFHLDSASGCTTDSLKIYQSSRSQSLLARYCGDVIPNAVDSPSNTMLIDFTSDASNTFSGFSATYTSIYSKSCGGTLSSPSGLLKSPNYPSNYPVNANCTWSITVGPQYVVQLTFQAFSLEHDDICASDSIIVYESIRRQTQLGRYCGNVMPGPVTSLGNTMLVDFTSNYLEAYPGFSARYTSIYARACGGPLTTLSGELKSPLYPNQYPINANCTWSITVDPEYTIQLTFDDFQLETHNICAKDAVTIYETDAKRQLLRRLCGQTNPGTVYSIGNTMVIEFTSNDNNVFKGFSAKYTAVYARACGGTRTSTSGIILSPGYPSYPINANCIWRINVGPEYLIKLQFNNFTLESDIKCGADSLKIYDDSQKQTLLGSFCGASKPGPVTSTGNIMLMDFTSDSTNTFLGFNASYSAVYAKACGGVLSGLSGQLQSPEYPANYPINANCSWSISVGAEYNIKLTFNFFNLETHDKCDADSVSIYENSSKSRLLGRFCGQSSPPIITSSGNTMLITFSSDSRNTFPGFVASYEAVYARECGGHFDKLNGTITSPGYPNAYPNDVQCEYHLASSPGTIIKLNITRFDLELDAECSIDYLQIHNGATPTSPLIGQYCGTKFDRILQSTSNNMYLKFVSDSSKSRQGFSINYDGTETVCGGNLTSNQGIIKSPNYPRSYPNSMGCVWMITVPKERTITMSFSDLNIESHDDCSFDYIVVYDGPSSGYPMLLQACGDDKPADVISSRNQMTVHFISDENKNYRGFNATYSLTEEKTTVVMPTVKTFTTTSTTIFSNVTASVGESKGEILPKAAWIAIGVAGGVVILTLLIAVPIATSRYRPKKKGSHTSTMPRPGTGTPVPSTLPLKERPHHPDYNDTFRSDTTFSDISMAPSSFYVYPNEYMPSASYVNAPGSKLSGSLPGHDFQRTGFDQPSIKSGNEDLPSYYNLQKDEEIYDEIKE